MVSEARRGLKTTANPRVSELVRPSTGYRNNRISRRALACDTATIKQMAPQHSFVLLIARDPAGECRNEDALDEQAEERFNRRQRR